MTLRPGHLARTIYVGAHDEDEDLSAVPVVVHGRNRES